MPDIRTLIFLLYILSSLLWKFEKKYDFRFLYFSVLNEIINYCLHNPCSKCVYTPKFRLHFGEVICLTQNRENRVQHMNSTEPSHLKTHWPQKSFQMKFYSNALLAYLRLCFVKNVTLSKRLISDCTTGTVFTQFYKIDVELLWR